MFSYKIPAVVFSRNLQPDKVFLRAAEKARVPIFVTPLITMKFINRATLALEMNFAPRGSEIGSMVDILGVGAIIRGESGIGKSESVLALIERGYSLVSDDVTRVTLIDGRDVMGTSAELTRAHMEVRGIGIINVASMFGVRSIRSEKKVDLVITLKAWEEVADIDRLGMEQEYVKILGVEIPHIIIPVRPGRDLARLIEVAAFQIKLKSSGYNAAKELNERLVTQMGGKVLNLSVNNLPATPVQPGRCNLLGARASRPPLSASGRKHSPLNAVGGTPTAATGTVALPNPKRMVAPAVLK